MRHSDEQIEQAAQRFEKLADSLDPDDVHVDHLKAVAAASEAIRHDEARLRQAVHAARERGRPWNQLATALGVSRQAARQRFAEPASR